MPNKIIHKFQLALALGCLLAIPLLSPLAGAAPSVNLAAPNGALVFTFDGGYVAHANVSTMLEAHGYRGTFYVASDFLHQGPYYAAYLSAQDLVNMTARGHDVESMTKTQPDLTTTTDAQLQTELAGSQSALQSIIGRPVRHVAYPYGAHDARVNAATMGTYVSGRGVTTNVNDFVGPVFADGVPGLMIGQSTTLTAAESYVDFAIAQKTTVIFAFENIAASPGAYDWTPAQLDALLAYAQGKAVQGKTIADVFTASAPTTPSAPSLAATPGSGQVTLTWNAPADGGSPITSYRIYRGTASGTEAFYATATQTNYTDVVVSDGTAYVYQVSAMNGAGEGARSNEASATPGVPSNARLVFTFNNGYASGMSAAQILEAHGLHGTYYVSNGLLRQGAYYTAYLSAADLTNLSGRGHDIESMTVDQKDLTTLTAAQVASELADSQTALQNILGKPVRHLAYPYGAVNPSVANATASKYDSGRTLTGSITDFAAAPADSYHRPALIVRQTTSVATAQSYIDYAIAHNVPVVLAFGAIVASPGAYDWTPANLDALAAYAQSKGIPVVTMAQLVAGGSSGAPGVPDAPSLSVIPGNSAVNMSWTIPDNHGSAITGYRIYRGTSSGNEILLAAVSPQTNYRDFPVDNSATYYYQVSATNAKGEGLRSNEAVAIPNAQGVPPGAAIVFTFDDGLRSQLQAVPTLNQYKVNATFYINSGVLRENGDNPESMSPAEVTMLSQGGQDVESHMQFHDDSTTLTATQLDAELKNGQSRLRTLTGQPIVDLAWPYGAHNAQADANAAKYYRSGRGYNSDLSVATAHSTARYGIPSMGVFSGDSAAKIDGYVDYAIQHNVTVILVIHNLAPVPGNYGVTLDNYDWNLAAFKSVVAYTVAHHVPVKTIRQLGDAGRLPPN